MAIYEEYDRTHLLSFRNIGSILFLCFLLIVIAPRSASATGFGVYGSYGAGDAAGGDFRGDVTHKGIGFLLDTGVRRDRLFNYRLQTGYEEIDSIVKEHTYYDGINGNTTVQVRQYLKAYSYVFDNDFGFGIFREPWVRAWIGPEIRFSVSRGNLMGDPNRSSSSVIGFGYGPVVGVNLHMENDLSLALRTGYRVVSHSELLGGDSREQYWFFDLSLIYSRERF